MIVPACGGCPWTSISSITTSPDVQCLGLHTAGSSGQAPSTGCVNPVVLGHNNCSGPLVIPASVTTAAMDLTFQPSEDIQFEVPLGIATYHANNNSDRYDWSIIAQLGGQPLTIGFHGSI
jgi:hypothetical protein